MDQGMSASLGWLYGTGKALTGGFWENGFIRMLQGIGRAQNVNLTALRPATFITNVMSNVLAKGTRDGTLPNVVMGEMLEAHNVYRIANSPAKQVRLFRKDTPKSAKLADDVDSMKAMEGTGYVDKSFIDAEARMLVDDGSI